jgi:hypothetical protein
MLRTLASVFLAFGASAQVPVLKTYRTIGLTILHRASPTTPYNTHFRGTPANTVLTTTTDLTVRVGSGFAWSQLQTTVRPFLGRRTSTIIIEEQSDLQDPFSGGQFDVSTSTKVLRQPHEWLLQLPADAKGNELHLSALPIPGGIRSHHAKVAIDVGNNGKLDFVHDMLHGGLSRVFMLGTKAVDVRILTYGHVNWSGTGGYGMRIGMTLNPRTALKFTNYSTGCGMKLTASDRLDNFGHHFRLFAEGGFPNSSLLFEIGAQKAKIRLPGGCDLDLIPLIIIHRIADPQGKYLFGNDIYPLSVFHIPDGLVGTFFIQAVGVYSKFGVTQYRTSNAIEADAGK